MKMDFAGNLYRLRKENRLTQEQVAKRTGVSFQAVSKWENGQSYPDIELLPVIARVLETSLDALMGYPVEKSVTTDYERRYQQAGFYWGNQIWQGALSVLRFLPPERPMRLLDVGCGEGQAAVFFGKNSYQVSGFDISPSGIAKGRLLAAEQHVDVDFFEADINRYQTDAVYDVMYASGSLQYIRPERRASVIGWMKQQTRPGGIHVLNVFVEKPFLPVPPDWETQEYFWQTGELFRLYHDWRIEEMREEIFDCMSGGVPHRHCMDVLTARRVE